jgi:hypothetical protein
MSDAFSDREKGFEAKFKLDAEAEFKIEARRNKLLGLWLAREYGLVDSEAEAYAKEVIISDMDEPGIEDVVRKVMADIEKHDASITEEQVRAKIAELDSIAAQQYQDELAG